MCCRRVALATMPFFCERFALYVPILCPLHVHPARPSTSRTFHYRGLWHWFLAMQSLIYLKNALVLEEDPLCALIILGTIAFLMTSLGVLAATFRSTTLRAFLRYSVWRDPTQHPHQLAEHR